MSDAMRGATKAMVVMNRRMNVPAMQKILQNFEMQSEMMDMKEEMMGDAMDDIFNEDQEEEETDDIINQVLDEIGISLSSEVCVLFLFVRCRFDVRAKLTLAFLAGGCSNWRGRHSRAAEDGRSNIGGRRRSWWPKTSWRRWRRRQQQQRRWSFWGTLRR